MPDLRIHDPCLYQWLFFLRSQSRDSETQRREHARQFQKTLIEALNSFGDPLPAEGFSSDDNPSSPQVSLRLASVPWKERDGTFHQLEARTLLDTSYLQIGQARKGESTPEVFSSLQPWMPSSLSDEYLGSARCLCAEVEEGTEKDVLTELASEILRHALGLDQAARLEGVLLPCGFLALSLDADEEVWVLLYPPSGNRSASRLVHRFLPLLLLSRVKARKSAKEYFSTFLPQAYKQEQELDALLKEAGEPRLPLEKLERLSADISRKQAAFVESISSLEELFQTMKICVRNVELLLEEPIWGEVKREAHPLLLDWLRLLTEQMETDIRYLRITQEQADLALASLTTVSSVRSTQWERRITLLLGLFAIMEAPQVFPELAWWWRLALIGLGGILIGLGWWLWRR